MAQAGKLGAVTHRPPNMAGRGTDIMLGGNAEFLAKNDLKKAGYSDEAINEATGYADTDDEEILAARALFAERLAAHRAVTDAEAERVRAAGGALHPRHGAARGPAHRQPAAAAAPAARATPGESRFFLALTDDIMRLFGSERVMGMVAKNLDDDTPAGHEDALRFHRARAEDR